MTENIASYNLATQAPIATRPQVTAMVEVEQQRAMAEVQAAIVLAKRYPRDQIAAMDRILVACQRPGLAEQALYSYARGGTEITGPSIRLAEAIAQQWGNIQYGIRELEQQNGESTVEAFAWDMETNVRQIKVFQVKHERHTKKGSYKLEDSRDIYELVANQGARRLRACILGIIPGDIIEAAVGQCERTLKAKADTSPEALQKLVAAFGALKVTKEQIEKRIQRRLETITPAQLIQLRKVYNSIKDGMSSPADWFETAPPPPAEDAAAAATASLKARVRQKIRKAQDDIVVQDENRDDVPEFDPPLLSGDCPRSPGDRYTEKVCAACPERDGCPAW